MRIDMITHIDGVEFDDAWAARLHIRLADQTAGVLSQAHLIQNKRIVGRAQDIADIEWLERPDQDDR